MKNNKITIRLSDETLKKCNEGMDITNCKVRNEFIEKAIEFYSGYVSAEVHSVLVKLFCYTLFEKIFNQI